MMAIAAGRGIKANDMSEIAKIGDAVQSLCHLYGSQFSAVLCDHPTELARRFRQAKGEP